MTMTTSTYDTGPAIRPSVLKKTMLRQQNTETEQAAPEHAVAPKSSHRSGLRASEHQASGLPIAATSPERQSLEPAHTVEGAQDDRGEKQD